MDESNDDVVDDVSTQGHAKASGKLKRANVKTDLIVSDLTSDSKALAKFSSFESNNRLLTCIELLEDQTSQLFSKRSSNFLDSEMKLLAPEIKYEIVKYYCIHGDKPRSRSVQHDILRPDLEYTKFDCPARFILKCKPVGDTYKLVVTSSNFRHTHPINKEWYKYYSKNRNNIDNEVSTFIENKKDDNMPIHKIAQKVRSKFGSKILTKDVENFLSKLSEAKGELTEAQKIVNFLKTKSDEDSESKLVIGQNDQEEIEMIFFQNCQMRKDFENFPDLVLIDGTYRTNNYNYTLLVFLVVDQDRKGRIVALSYLRREDSEHMDVLMSTFCEVNGCNAVKLVLVDKDLTEINSIRKFFTSAHVLLCEVHVQRSLVKFVDEMFEKYNFKGDRKKLKMKIKSLLIAMLKSSIIEGFESRAQEFFSNVSIPKDYIEKFRSRWYDCKSLWARYFRHNLPTLGISSTNMLEAQNRHIKSFLNKLYPSFSECLRGVFDFIESHQSNSAYREFKSQTKLIGRAFLTEEETEKLIWKTFSPFAADKILSQLEFSGATEFRDHDQGILVCTGEDSSCHFLVNCECTACVCKFSQQFQLPCSHIFAARSYLNLSLFESELVSSRFLKRDSVRVSCSQTDNSTQIRTNACMHESNPSDCVSANSADTGHFLSEKSSHDFARKRSASPVPNTALKKYKPSVDSARVSNLSTEKYNEFRFCLMKLIDCATSGKTFQLVTESSAHSTQTDSEKNCMDSVSAMPNIESASVQIEKNVNFVNLKLGNQPIKGKPRGVQAKQPLPGKSAKKRFNE